MGSSTMSCNAEAQALLQCTSSPGSDACAAAFMAMRECNRGKKMMELDSTGSLSILDGKDQFVGESVAGPPPRTIESMRAVAEEYAKKLGINGVGSIRF